MKKILSFLLVVTMMLTTFCMTPVYAGGEYISPDKDAYTINEEMNITVTGISEALKENGCYVSIYKQNARHENYGDWEYVIDLDETSGVWTVEAPDKPGNYEIRLYADENYEASSLLESYPITVSYITDRTATVVADKKAYTPNEEMKITVAEVTEAQKQSSAYIAIYKKNARHEDYQDWEYVIDLDENLGVWTVNAPREVGDYEIRLYAADVQEDDALYVTIDLPVTYSTTETTVKLNKTVFAPNEKIVATIEGVTEAQKQSSAYVSIYKKNARHEDFGEWEYIIDLDETLGKWTVNAPYETGEYEIRLYANGDNTDGSLLVTVPITVTGTPVNNLEAGTNGLSGWAVEEVQYAIEHNLTTEKVMVEFSRPITREEFCELAIKLYEAISGETAEAAPSSTFTDTKNPQILKAFNLGIVNGVGNNKFAPSSSVTRQEIAAMLLRTVKVAVPDLDTTVTNPQKFVDSKSIASWATEGINYFSSKEIIKGANGAFMPKANCTCEAAIALIRRVFDSFTAI